MQKSEKQIKKKESKGIIGKDTSSKGQQKQKRKIGEKEQKKIEEKQVGGLVKQQQKDDKKQQLVTLTNNVVDIQIDIKQFSPINQNISFTSFLQYSEISSPKIFDLYNNPVSNNTRLLIKPIFSGQDSKYYMLFRTEGLLKYQDMFIQLQDQFIFLWLVELLYKLHPAIYSNLKDPVYPKLTKQNIFLAPNPYLDLAILRQEKYSWTNPIRVLVTSVLDKENQYFQQMVVFNQQFSSIKCFNDLQRIYNQKFVNKFKQELYTVQKLSRKLKQLMQEPKKNISKIDKWLLDNETIQWISKQLKINQKSTFELGFRCSNINFDSSKFWEKIKTIQTNGQTGQIIALHIQSADKQQKTIGFYSSLFIANTKMANQSLSQYVIDNDKKSMLINFSQRTIHHLKDPKYAFTFNNQILLCIGKCDIVLSSFNITNLCYFPVSFEPDIEGLCTNAQTLCGGKKFKLKQIQVYVQVVKLQ